MKDCTGLNRKISFRCSQYDRTQCLSTSTPLIQLCGALQPLELLWMLRQPRACWWHWFNLGSLLHSTVPAVSLSPWTLQLPRGSLPTRPPWMCNSLSGVLLSYLKASRYFYFDCFGSYNGISSVLTPNIPCVPRRSCSTTPRRCSLGRVPLAPVAFGWFTSAQHLHPNIWVRESARGSHMAPSRSQAASNAWAELHSLLWAQPLCFKSLLILIPLGDCL